jgi:MFS family permease
VIDTLRSISGNTILTSMTFLAGVTSLLIGNAYSAQMPSYATDLGHGEPGVSYSLLLAADAAGALSAGIALEAWGSFKPTPKRAILLAILWGTCLLAFACTPYFPAALVLLFGAGFFELSFNTMAQTLVQLNAPIESRGRVVGLFNMSGLGMRAFSGISVGVLGAWIGVHWSLALAACVLLIILLIQYRYGATATPRQS